MAPVGPVEGELRQATPVQRAARAPLWAAAGHPTCAMSTGPWCVVLPPAGVGLCATEAVEAPIPGEWVTVVVPAEGSGAAVRGGTVAGRVAVPADMDTQHSSPSLISPAKNGRTRTATMTWEAVDGPGPGRLLPFVRPAIIL
eukprot:gene9037-biopygen6814